MLNKTFCHIDGVSLNSEKILWENGVNDWDSFLEKYPQISCLPKSKIEKIRTEILFSKENLDLGNIFYFKNKLDSKEHYRCVGFGKVAFVDIETTGLSRYTDDITMIGIYDGLNPKTYVKGIDLDDAILHLENFDIVVTFNGKNFDIPFIEYKYRKKFDFIHLDLRFMLKEFGYSGGLKVVEKSLGLSRDDEVCDINGFEAVKLWKRYQKGDDDALRKLLLYNKEDIVNLKCLLDHYLKLKCDFSVEETFLESETDLTLKDYGRF